MRCRLTIGIMSDMASTPKPSDEELRARLTPEQFAVVRGQATEVPFSGKYLNHNDAGMYTCVACGQELFSSETKYDSGSGWPAFWAAAGSDKVEFRPDTSHGMQRTEVVCSKCGAHLGHVFEGGPQPTGKNFCINSLALDFDPVDSTQQST